MTAVVVALDAMGVIYTAGDDVAQYLVPYCIEHGSSLSANAIEELYRACSLGEVTSAQFWARCGIDATASDADYCSHHELTPGMLNLLDTLTARGYRLAVLSNDVSEWSRELRRRFALDRWIDTWVISGDIGRRKPAPQAYAALVDAVGVEASAIHFIDDRPANVDAARAFGLSAELFTSIATVRPQPGEPSPRDRS